MLVAEFLDGRRDLLDQSRNDTFVEELLRVWLQYSTALEVSPANDSNPRYFFPSLARYRHPHNVTIFPDNNPALYSQMRIQWRMRFLHNSMWFAFLRSLFSDRIAYRCEPKFTVSSDNVQFWEGGAHLQHWCQERLVFWTARMDLHRGELVVAAGVLRQEPPSQKVRDLNTYLLTNLTAELEAEFKRQLQLSWDLKAIALETIVNDAQYHHLTKAGRCHEEACRFRDVNHTHRAVGEPPIQPTDMAFRARRPASRRELNTDPENQILRVRLLPLYENPTIMPDLDVVLFHGWGGEGRSTWEWESSDHRHTVLWPRDLLAPSLAGRVRVISVEYINAPIGDITPPMRILGQLFLTVLPRVGVGLLRPVAWVGHSMGGLHIKALLSRAAQLSNHSSISDWDRFYAGQLVRNTLGIVFLGTPHRCADPVDTVFIVQGFAWILCFGVLARILVATAVLVFKYTRARSWLPLASLLATLLCLTLIYRHSIGVRVHHSLTCQGAIGIWELGLVGAALITVGLLPDVLHPSGFRP